MLAAMVQPLPDPQPTLTTERLVLAPYALEDEGWVAELAGPLDVARWTGLPHPMDRPIARTWLTDRTVQYAAGRSIGWAARLRSDGTPIGGGSLRLNVEFELADLGFWLGAAHWRQGYATEIAMRVADFAFDDWGARRLEAHCVADNAGSSRLLTNLGFVEEGRLRQGFQRFGAIHDLLLYGLLREERRPDGSDQSPEESDRG